MRFRARRIQKTPSVSVVTTSSSSSSSSSFGSQTSNHRDSMKCSSSSTQDNILLSEEKEKEEQETEWWKHLPCGAEQIVRGLAAQHILHELLNRLAHRETVPHDVIRAIVLEFPLTCQRTYEFVWEDGSSLRQLYPLAMIACLLPPLETVQTIYLAYPPAINVAEECKGALPLHMAAAFEASLEVVQFLHHQHESAISTPRHDQVQAVHLACGFYLGEPDVVDFLLDEYPNSIYCICHAIRWTPLHSAAHGGIDNLRLLQRLHRMDPTQIQHHDRNGRTPLHLACRSKKTNATAIAFFVQTHRQTLGLDDRTGWISRFLLDACVFQPPHVIAALLDQVQDWNQIQTSDRQYGGNLLHWAVRYNSRPASVDYLARRFPEMCLATTSRADHGQTPLAWAVNQGASLQVIQILVRRGPQALRILDVNGRTPLTMARRRRRNSDILEFLKQSEEMQTDSLLSQQID